VCARKPDRHGGLSLPNLRAELRPPVLVGRLARIQPFGRQQASLDTPYQILGIPTAEMASTVPNDPLVRIAETPVLKVESL